MIPQSKQNALRLRRDLLILARKASQTSHSGETCVIHNPTSGTTVRLDRLDFDRLSGGLTNKDDPLVKEACDLQLLSGPCQPSQASPTVNPWWRNPLYIRLPGVPADWVAVRLAHSSDWIFGSAFVAFWCACFVVTIVTLVAHSQELLQSLPSLASFQTQHWGIAVGVLAITKILHELAHAAVCRRMGAPCRQIGALLLCGTPCLYCDVSESWRIASPIRRSAVMMAGIYVECILATIASWLWLSLEPSILRMLALHVIMVCGVSTIAFNINPLMRYDGYYVLSDLLNVTNLKSKAGQTWNRFVFFPLAGIRTPAKGNFDHQAAGVFNGILIVYHACSAIYRYVVVAGLTAWIYYLTIRCGLEPLGRVLTMLVSAAIAVGWVRSWGKMMMGQGIWKQVKFYRRVLFGLSIIAVIACILFVPWRERITATGSIDYADATNVYVPADALVDEVLADYHEAVRQGQPLVQLGSAHLRLQHPELVAQVRKLELTLQSLNARAAAEPELLMQISTTKAMLESANRRLSRLEQQIGSLLVRAPLNGSIVRSLHNVAGEQSLAMLSAHAGASVSEGHLWCRIGNDESKQVTLRVDASQRATVKLGGEVRLRVHCFPVTHESGIISCEVTDISDARVDQNFDTTVASQDRFEITCLLPSQTATHVPIGTPVIGTFRGETKTLAMVITDRVLGMAK